MMIFAALIILPMLNCLVLSMTENKRIVNLASSLAIALYIACLLGLKSKGFDGGKETILKIFELSDNLALSFKINAPILNYLFLLGFIWLIFEFYIKRFFEIAEGSRGLRVRLLFVLNIGFINLIILSTNIFCLTIFATILSLFYYLIFDKFLCKQKNIYTQFFKFLILSEPFLLLLGSILTFYLSKQTIFAKDGILLNQNLMQTILLFGLYFSAIFLTIFSISYIFYSKYYDFEPITNYVILVLFYGFFKIFFFIKIITELFGLGLFSSIISRFGLETFEIIFLINILVAFYFLLFGKDFKSIFFYLFFSQLIFAFFSIFIFALYNESRINGVLTSFVLSLTLMFLTFSNLILYLKKAENKDFVGIFYNMKVTISLMIFSFLNMIGFTPTIAGLEKYALLKISVKHHLPFLQFMLVLNAVALILFALKIFFSAFFKPETPISAHDKALSLKIDSASSLMLTSLVVTIIMVLLPIIK